MMMKMMSVRTKVLLGVAVAGSWSMAQGCRYREVDTTHCNYNEGDAYCAEKFPDGSHPFCETGFPGCVSPQRTFGCVADRPADECYGPCGGGSTLMEDGTCLEPMASSGESSGSGSSGATETGESTETGSTTGPLPCVGNEDCMDPAAPFCEPVSGECVRCDGVGDGDAACAELDAGAPLCVEGTCVQCTGEAAEACTGVTPVCDAETSTCVPCVEHAQCGEAACNLFTGACLPSAEEGDVVHVGAGEDFATIGEAVASFDAKAEGTIVVHGGASYDESVTVDSGRTLAFLAAELGPMVEPPRWIRSAGTLPQLTVTDGTVLMDGMQVSGNQSNVPPGVLVDGGRAWLDRSRIVNNSGGGIVAQTGAELTVRNCFVGGDVNDRFAVAINDATGRLDYSTVGAGFGVAVALSCSKASTVEVRNSLVVSRGLEPEIQCDAAVIETSATEMDLGGTNTALGDMDVAWFGIYGTGDFHVVAGAPLSIGNAARWEDGDPATDIDGDERPLIDGAPDAAGADVP